MLAGMWGAPLPRTALATAVVIRGDGDKHYFSSNSLIMSVLPHEWLSKASPEPLTPAEGLCVRGAWKCVCPEMPEDELHACFVRECNPLSRLLSTLSSCLNLLFTKPSFIEFAAAFKECKLWETTPSYRLHIF